MSTLVVVILWAAVVAYAVSGGADFGSGFWDALAGGAEAGKDDRKRIDRSIGPVWEANHVWLIFILVYLWTAFPKAFAAIVTALFVPLIGVAVGITLRGAAFALRKSSSTFAQARVFGIAFALSSIVTPFFMGAAAGAIASGRVPLNADVDPLTVWLGPTSILGGVLAVGTCAWLAAVFLAADSARDGEAELAAAFTTRAIWTGLVVGVISLIGVFVLETDATTLADGLERAGAPLLIVSGIGGLFAMWLLRQGRPGSARLPAIIAVVAIVVGWGVGQYPWILVDEVEIEDVVAGRATLMGLIIAFVGAALLVVPSLIWLFRLTNMGQLSAHQPRADSSLATLNRLQTVATASSSSTANGDGEADGTAAEVRASQPPT